MSYDGMLLKSVVEEINDKLENSRLDKVHQPTNQELTLNFRSPEGSHSLLLSASSNYPRMYFTQSKFQNPSSPPLFCMVLRKHLQGARFKEARQYGQDRICSLVFESKNELGDPILLKLVIEIMGKYSNIILVREEDQTIVDCITKVGASMSSVREILPGKTYNPQDISEKKSIFGKSSGDIQADFEAWPQGKNYSGFLMTTYMGISKTLTREISFRAQVDESRPKSSLSPEEKEGLIQETLTLFKDIQEGHYHFALYEDQDRLLDFSNVYLSMYQGKEENFSSPSALLEGVYLQRAHRDLMQQKSTALRKNLKRQLSRDYTKLGKLENELERSKDRDKYRVYGDLLSSKLHEVDPGATSIDIENFYSPDLTPVTIPLDPKYTPAQNANRMYKRYQKLKTANKVLQDQIDKTKNELSLLEEIHLQLNWAETPGELDEIKESYDQIRGKAKKHKKKKNESSSPMHFESPTGHFYVGKNNKQNEEVTFQVASKDDLWFHVRENPGSHVILKTKTDGFENKDMVNAAKLAAYYSKLQGSNHVDVDYTLKKYIKHHPAKTPGLVHYTNFKTVHVSGEKIPKDLERVDSSH